MFRYVRGKGSLFHLGIRGQIKQFGQFRIVHSRYMRLYMGCMILIYKGFHRLANHQVHVLRDRIGWLHIVRTRHDLVCIPDSKNFQHLAVQKGQVIHLRSLCRQLKGCLILHNPLRHSP